MLSKMSNSAPSTKSSSSNTNDTTNNSNGILTDEANSRQQPLLPLEMIPTTSNSSSSSSSSSNVSTASNEETPWHPKQERRVVLKHGSWALAIGGDNHTCWSYGNTNNNNNNNNNNTNNNNNNVGVSSTCLLEVTYRSAREAMPRYTRSTYARIRRLWKSTSTGFCKSTYYYADSPTHTYTLADVHSIHKASPQALSSLHQNLHYPYTSWKGIQIFLHPHTTTTSTSTSSSSTTNNNHHNTTTTAATITLDEVQPFLHTSTIVITFAIPTSHPYHDNNNNNNNDTSQPLPLLWKVDFPLDSNVAMDHVTILRGSLDYYYYQQQPQQYSTKKKHPTHIYLNGWQSWSFAGTVPRGQPQPTSAMPNYLSKSFNYGASHPPHHPHHYYKSDMYLAVTSNDKFHTLQEEDMLDENNSSCIIFGFLSQKKQFGLITMDHTLTHVAMHCSFDGIVASTTTTTTTTSTLTSTLGIATTTAPTTTTATKSTDWAWCQILMDNYNNQQKEPLAQYLDAVSTYNHARHTLREPNCIGWCSWYHYYENIAEQVLIDNLDHLKSNNSSKVIPWNMAMCDDGYMTAWGDWNSLKPDKFSSSMRSISTAMKARGMRPGIWLAPFAADKHSELVKRHPDWIIRNDSGKPANSSNCGKFFYGLDATNPQVLDHARTTIQLAVNEWGFEVLKLDFLYACCLEGNGKYDLSRTRAETMSRALQTLREAAGDDVFIIGCGCPLGPAVGIVDGMRVSADTGPTWYPSFPLPWWDNATLPCLRAMVRNSLSRAPLSHRWFHNDPDCLLLGTSTDLTTPEVLSAATVIGMTGGMLLVSDDIGKLPTDRLDILNKLIPLPRAVGQPLDLHCSYDNSIPSIMQLWCSDDPQCNEYDQSTLGSIRTGSFRSCIPMCSGLGQWTVVSLSNWLEVDAVVSAPFCSLVSHPLLGGNNGIKDCSGGYHVFTFWSSKYVWVPALPSHPSAQRRKRSSSSLSKRLGPHQSEIFHLKPVFTNGEPQYIGSDYHFTCGMEVVEWISSDHELIITFNPQFVQRKAGKIFLSLPSSATTSTADNTGLGIRATMDTTSLEVTVVTNISSTYNCAVVRIRVPSNSDSSRVVITY